MVAHSQTLWLLGKGRISDAPEKISKCKLITAEKLGIFNFYTHSKEKYQKGEIV